MMRRPPPEPGDLVETVEKALDWLAETRLLFSARRVS
jgi:hypothetical protein